MNKQQSDKLTLPLTDEAYVEKGHGSLCPACGSCNVESTGDLEVCDVIDAVQPIACNDCSSTWKDRYELVGYTDLFSPNPLREYTVTLAHPAYACEGDAIDTWVGSVTAANYAQAAQDVQAEAWEASKDISSADDFTVLTIMHVEDGKIVVDL